MKSMTGYGEGTETVGVAKVTVQIRSLNHRHLDLQLRMPREYFSLEEEIRKVLRSRISRGRVDLFVNRYGGKGKARKLEMDEELVGQYIGGMKQLQKKYRLPGEVSVALLSNIPDLLHVREPEVDAAGERQAVIKALGNALKKLERSRAREGAHLKADIDSQIRYLTRIARLLEEQTKASPVRLHNLHKGSPDAVNGAGGEKEPLDLANTTVKGDVNEEIVRLKTHVAALGNVIREREPMGKKIDFMLQEVNRELNTISAKIPQLEVVQLVLQGKERAEKIREQVQNVE